jgi:hypothetical protein
MQPGCGQQAATNRPFTREPDAPSTIANGKATLDFINRGFPPVVPGLEITSLINPHPNTPLAYLGADDRTELEEQPMVPRKPPTQLEGEPQ